MLIKVEYFKYKIFHTKTTFSYTIGGGVLSKMPATDDARPQPAHPLGNSLLVRLFDFFPVAKDTLLSPALNKFPPNNLYQKL